MFYLVTIPKWMRSWMPHRIWEMSSTEKKIYLSFDDGPHPEITHWVLDELKQHDAKASFFCLGKNVRDYPDVYTRILQEGHRVGNHGFHHLNASSTHDREYMEDVRLAKEYIDSDLFRPPYGKINQFKVKLLMSDLYNLKTVMWSVLSGDFDQNISKEQCLNNVLLSTNKGSIVVFHDSKKAEEKLRYALPLVLRYFKQKGFEFAKLP